MMKCAKDTAITVSVLVTVIGIVSSMIASELTKTGAEIDQIRSDYRADIKELKNELREDMQEIKSDIRAIRDSLNSNYQSNSNELRRIH